VNSPHPTVDDDEHFITISLSELRYQFPLKDPAEPLL